MKIELGEWLPDQPALENPGCTQAKNVVPRATSFGQLRSLNAFSSALNSACLGAIWMLDDNGAAKNFAGTADRLYSYNGTGGWTDVSRTATYSTSTQWQFEKYGDRCIAVNIENAPQYFDVNTSAKFQNIGGSPPNARYVATVRDFLVLANLTSQPYTVQWSGFNNSELWTGSLSTQSDEQDLVGKGGVIQGIVGGAYGVVFQESSIWRMDYQGPPVVFRFDEVETNRGTPAPRSIVPVGSNVFFYDWSGWHVFDGQGSTPIGNERVDAWFARNCGDVTSIQGAVDRANRIIMWGFKSTSAPTYNDRILMFNYGVGKWSWGEVTTQFISEKRGQQLTLDQLDTPLPGGPDVNPIPMDSLAFDSDITLQAFNSLNQAAVFEGTPLTAVVETKELGLESGYAETNAVFPGVDGDSPTITVRVGYRNRQAQTASYSNSISLNRIGEACRVTNARFQRFEMTITGGFDYARGVDIRARKAGRR